MARNDDDCVKRIIKSFLYFNGEATTRMILDHIHDVNYGLQKEYTPKKLSSNMRRWLLNMNGRNHWFNVEPFKKETNGEQWWRLKNEKL